MFYAYHKHHITPEEFANMNETSQFLISLFTEREIEIEKEKIKQIKNAYK